MFADLIWYCDLPYASQPFGQNEMTFAYLFCCSCYVGVQPCSKETDGSYIFR